MRFTIDITSSVDYYNWNRRGHSALPDHELIFVDIDSKDFSTLVIDDYLLVVF